MFEKLKKKDISKVQMIKHIQQLSPLAEKNLMEMIEEYKEKTKKQKIGKSYMINKLLEEL